MLLFTHTKPTAVNCIMAVSSPAYALVVNMGICYFVLTEILLIISKIVLLLQNIFVLY